LLQVAYGQIFDINGFKSTVILTVFGPLNNIVTSGQALASSAIQQLNGNLSVATQSVQTQIQNATNAAQQQAASLSATYPQAQAQIQDCLNQQAQNLLALNSSASKYNTNVGLKTD
jgi:hypothetical protein